MHKTEPRLSRAEYPVGTTVEIDDCANQPIRGRIAEVRHYMGIIRVGDDFYEKQIERPDSWKFDVWKRTFPDASGRFETDYNGQPFKITLIPEGTSDSKTAHTSTAN